MLNTVASLRFRKLAISVIPSQPIGNTQEWSNLDDGVAALANRVNATAASDTLEVLFYCRFDVEWVLPRIASDPRVSLRVENRVRS
jgi:hypothetical protein